MACVGRVLGVQQFITSDFAVRSQVKLADHIDEVGAFADMLFQQLQMRIGGYAPLQAGLGRLVVALGNEQTVYGHLQRIRHR